MILIIASTSANDNNSNSSRTNNSHKTGSNNNNNRNNNSSTCGLIVERRSDVINCICCKQANDAMQARKHVSEQRATTNRKSLNAPSCSKSLTILRIVDVVNKKKHMERQRTACLRRLLGAGSLHSQQFTGARSFLRARVSTQVCHLQAQQPLAHLGKADEQGNRKLRVCTSKLELPYLYSSLHTRILGRFKRKIGIFRGLGSVTF